MSKRAAVIGPNSLKQKNVGKVQFNAMREEVCALLNKGYSRRALHAVLCEKNLFTGSYRRFCEYVQSIRNLKRGNEKPEPALALPENVTPTTPDNMAPQAALLEKPAAGGFVHHTTPNINDLI